jgi:plastocyanin
MTGLSKRWSRLLIVGLTATAFGAAACGGGSEEKSSATPSGTESGVTAGGGSEGSADAVVVDAKEFEFESSEVTVGAGDEVTLTNTGNIEHDITVDGAGVHFMAMPGETVSERINLDPGTYTFYCGVAGHREAGMEGTLVVEG